MSRCTKKNCPMVGVSADCNLKDCPYRTEADQNKDTIYREDAIKAIGNEPMVWTLDDEYTMGRRSQWKADVTAIESTPSVDRPQGEWKPKNHHTDYCSNCGFEETQWRTADYNFCPSCGAIMKGADDEHTV